MTPTLTGRLQTRILLSFIVAVPILILFNSLAVILVMLPITLLFETLYDYLQHRRWDSDWPLIYTFVGGMLEGFTIFLVLDLLSDPDLFKFAVLYSVIWVLSFIFVAGLLNIIFPYRRFKGGRIL